MPRSNEVTLVDHDIANYWKYFELPNPSLKSYFGLVRDGQQMVYTGTFDRLQDDKTFPEIARHVKRIQDEWDKSLSNIKADLPSLFKFEQDMKAKVGPLSHRLAYRYQVPNILEYYHGIHLPSSPIKREAVLAVIREFSSIRGLCLRSQHRTVEKMKKSTNSGSPFFTKRRLVINKTLPCEVANIDGTPKMSLSGVSWLATAVLGWRGREGGPKYDDTKQRVIWMFPFGVNVVELQCYQPLIEAAQKFNLVPAWVSMEAVDERITKLFDTKSPHDLVICTDFTAFDQHINCNLQEAAKTIIAAILNSDKQSNSWLNNVYSIKYTIPLNTAPGVFWKGNHGMASGSGGTNCDETLLHRAMQYEAAIDSGSRLNPYSQCLGDDGILTYPGISVDKVRSSYMKHGLSMQESKQYISKDDCVYLRRWHHKAYREKGICVGVYSTHRALGRLCYQEKFYDPDKWGPKMVALRQLSIIENVKYHPLREEFAEFCMARDKYRLGIDIPGFLSNIETIAKEAIDYMPDFLGYTKSMQKDSSIADWWIVKYLKSKA